MGLSPEYYDGCTDDVLDLYGELEDRIVSDIVRRIIKTGDVTESAKWQIRQAQQMGLLYDDILREVAKSTNKTDKEIKRMFENAGVETVNNDNRLHLKAGANPLDIRQSESMLQILNSVYSNSLTDLKNLTGTTAITSQTAYMNACNSAFMMVSSGAFSYQQALRTVLSEVAEKGATVTYPSGHVDRLDVAVRRSLLTGIGLASRQISEENSRLCGCDLMEISAHSGARPSHSAWQGQIVSLSGRRGYLSKSDIGYGTGAGFGGWNCRHDWYPFYEGISTRNYTQSDLDRLNAKDIEYRGKLYSEYEISQMLREKERQARVLKRERIAIQTAIEEGQDYLKDDLKAVNTKISNKSKEIEDFCRETGYQRDRFREQVGGKTSVGHTSSYNTHSTDRKKSKDTLRDLVVWNTNYVPKITKKFERGVSKVENPHLRNLFNSFYQDTTFEKSPKDRKRGSAFMKGTTKNIYIGTQASDSTIAHELFHKIDDTYQITLNRNFRNAINLDYKNLKNKAKNTGLSIQEMLYYTYEKAFETPNKLFDEYRGVSDIINGMTKGEVKLGYQHEKTYWSNPNNLPSETWAQFGRFLYDNNEDVINMVKELFPNTYDNVISTLGIIYNIGGF